MFFSPIYIVYDAKILLYFYIANDIMKKVVLILLFSQILVINVPLRVLREPSSEDTLLL